MRSKCERSNGDQAAALVAGTEGIGCFDTSKDLLMSFMSVRSTGHGLRTRSHLFLAHLTQDL